MFTAARNPLVADLPRAASAPCSAVRVEDKTPMRVALSLFLPLAASLLCAPRAFGGIDSQAFETVAPIPATITSVFPCGSWIEHESRGHYRFVLAEVGSGAGTEVYLQRIAETIEPQGQVLRVASTTPIRELNNDHAQYQVSAARCIGGKTAELRATFEHDEGRVERRIRLVPDQRGYKIRNVIVRTPTRSR